MTSQEGIQREERQAPDEILNGIVGCVLVTFYTTLVWLFITAMVAACGSSPVSISSGPQALELSGVPTDEIRLVLTTGDEQIYEARGELYARLRSQELEFDTTLPIALEVSGTEAHGRLIVPGIPGQPTAQLTGTLWGTLDLGSAGRREIEVPISLVVGPRGTISTSGHVTDPPAVTVLFVLLFVSIALLVLCIALWNLHPSFEECRRWSDAGMEAAEKGITGSQLLAYVRFLEPKGAPATSDADAVNARGE
jgi:hypothetical protein